MNYKVLHAYRNVVLKENVFIPADDKEVELRQKTHRENERKEIISKFGMLPTFGNYLREECVAKQDMISWRLRANKHFQHYIRFWKIVINLNLNDNTFTGRLEFQLCDGKYIPYKSENLYEFDLDELLNYRNSMNVKIVSAEIANEEISKMKLSPKEEVVKENVFILADDEDIAQRKKDYSKEVINDIIKRGRQNNDGSWDINGDVLINNLGLNKIPLKFNKVSGNFHCENNNLTSLEGSPEEVGGYFNCSINKLTSLIGAPNEINKSFFCSNNKLNSLKGAPKIINYSFCCSKNNLTSLEGSPKKMGGDFECYDNSLITLEGGPIRVGGTFNCRGNRLISLVGAPKYVGKYFICSHNKLTSLEGAPEEVGGDFYCPDNAKIFTKKDVSNVSRVKENIYVRFGL